MIHPRLKRTGSRGLALAFCALTAACGDKGTDPAKPAVSGPQSLSQRLSEGGGYKQDENGQWVPKSDKRSSFENQGDSPYFKASVDKKAYRTGDYAGKKSWWGSKEYEAKGYGGDTGASRFQGSKARQDGMVARDNGKGARESGTFKTNSLESKSARESGTSPIGRPLDPNVESRRGDYKAPSVIGWREQRSMSVEQSKGLLGR